ncbi:MAG: TetR/AcrR family transcriptional regulator [Pseudomonas sp.]|uniref:TetR/AcrR family transcriptional regulator n=1 Tax=Pseudomonas sp. TaxID=306 RepID=UPI00120A6DDB|nr:TetR/AcrR family transcriptional regulator [Pseudomonas sp.]RZI76951.1 MAG: TetR/AcrR family transcriptional regulator [Pseudomonas sp.]
MASKNPMTPEPAQITSTADRARLNALALRSRDARARRTIARLREGLLSLIERVPLEVITIDDIVHAAKVSRSTFYRHFATKEAFVEDIAEAEIHNLVEHTFPLLSSADSSAACMAVVNYVSERRKLWSILLNGGAAGFMRSRFIKLAAQVGPGQLDDAPLALPLDLGAAFGVSATVEVLSWWLRQPVPIPLEEVAALVDRLAVRPALDASPA